MEKIIKFASKGVAYLRRNGIREFGKRAARKVVLSMPLDYEKWLERQRPSGKELKRQQREASERRIRIGIYIPAAEEQQNLRSRTVKSLKEQSDQNYCFPEEFPGEAEYLLFLREGVRLEPDALFVLVSAAENNPEMELFYADQDLQGKTGKGSECPECKPCFDPYYLQSRNYIGDAFLVRRSLVLRTGMPDTGKKSAVFYDYLLRCAEQTEKVMRIPEVLFHMPVCRPDPLEKEALAGHYRRLRISADIQDSAREGTYLTHYRYQDTPLLSVIIPNCDQAAQLRSCVESVLEMGGYDNLEILIVENNSRESETFSCYGELVRKDPRVRILTWKGKFHYSAINNDAVKEAKGEYLLFLNNDTRVRTAGSVDALMNLVRRPDVGAVGARLTYEDDTIQHAGVILGFGGIAGHALEGASREVYERQPFALSVRQLSAVTAACMAVKKKAFLEAGGFSDQLAVAYNDIDLCLSMRQRGWKVLYCPQAEVYHFESRTRGLEMTKEKAERVKREETLFRDRWKDLLEAGDPFYHPNLTLEKPDFSLKRSCRRRI